MVEEKTYRVAILRDGDDIGIGIERYNCKEIEFIGSYYLQVSEYSRRKTFEFIIDQVTSQLNEDEIATIRVSDPTLRTKRSWYRHFTNLNVLVYPARRFRDTNSLAADALNRKDTIIETLK
ncbi:hypothetical protein [Bacillus mesophilum]|uniref:Uncharacterized protein n=1 Tax=Bacillus mesophilum TaxID=1071718 RepID=A0A7V7UVM9_9BACI|nr:hypothetical protein [Bacillus mesophilum]KAB2332932.1 hypothetical protein F7732_12690 [Bacillus mesophilum]